MIAETAVLDYERLVADYNASLFATLRHHRSAGALEIWVPDDDPAKSILNMIEAAEIAGVAEISIRVGAQTLSRLDIAGLKAAADELGSFSLKSEGDSAIVTVSRIGGRHEDSPEEQTADWFAAVGSPYQEAVRAAAGRISHEGELDVPHGSTRYAGTADGVTLALAIDSRHTITAAAHEGATQRPDRAVMDTLCSILPGLTVQEASDHAAIRVERLLRADGERPVAGIVLPENADPIFVRPAHLLRELSREYACSTGYAPGRNTFTLRPSTAWLELSRESKLERVQAALDEAAPAAGLTTGDVRVVDIEHHLRATVAFSERVEVARKPGALMSLERSLQQSLEPRLQLFSVELKDANKLRRLKELP